MKENNEISNESSIILNMNIENNQKKAESTKNKHEVILSNKEIENENIISEENNLKNNYKLEKSNINEIKNTQQNMKNINAVIGDINNIQQYLKNIKSNIAIINVNQSNSKNINEVMGDINNIQKYLNNINSVIDVKNINQQNLNVINSNIDNINNNQQDLNNNIKQSKVKNVFNTNTVIADINNIQNYLNNIKANIGEINNKQESKNIIKSNPVNINYIKNNSNNININEMNVEQENLKNTKSNIYELKNNQQNLNNIKFNNDEINNNEKNLNNILSQEEILKAKENSFILIGKTGVGKTSLLNVIYGKDIGIVGHTTLSQTKSSSCYYIKEKIENKYIYFCIVDTPGLYDTNGVETDKIQKKDLMQLISKEGLIIKGLLFLANFQNERFDASEQFALIDYNSLFPLKDFWKRIIFVFTHYYDDPDSYTKEEIKENNNKYKSKIFADLMNKVKNVSKPIQFKDLNIKYVNVYSRNLNKKKIENNKKIREEIITEIIKYIKLKPMFNKLQIYNFQNYEIEKNDEYLYDCDFYVYLDANDKVVHQEFHINDKIKKINASDKEQKVELNIEDCEFNEEGYLIKRTTKKEGIEEIFRNYKGEIGGSLTVVSLIGAICSGFLFLPCLPVSLLTMAGGIYIWYKNKEEKEKNKKFTDEILINEKIPELIKNELKKYNELNY